MKRILVAMALTATMCVAISAQAAKYDEKSTDVARDGTFFYSEQIDFDAFLYVEVGIWHDDVTRVVKIDTAKFPTHTNALQFCYSIYVIEAGLYYQVDNFCGGAPISALSLFNATGLHFASSGLDLSCARDVGPYVSSDSFKSSEPRGLDRKFTSSTKYWYNLNDCTLVAFGDFFSGTGQQLGGVFKSSIKDSTY